MINPDFQIVTDTGQSLRVTTPAIFFWAPVLAVIVFSFVACFWVATRIPDLGTQSRAVTRAILRAAPFAEVLILAIALGWSHTLQIDWTAGTATSTDRFLGTFTTTHALRTAAIDRAIIDYDRSGPRIELVMQNGDVLAPFGVTSLFRRKQYVVLDAINAGLHRQAPAADHTSGPISGTAGAPASTAESSFDRMVRQQREFEQKLKAQKQAGERH